eukprot:TRINITY_DN4268_c0_g3_i1.p1 TRINITY_DN4268_c0_g3~~TRINITY_DN4268_c0_g3_i1.p1  ORF type:complete len:1127 (+),score=276.41 TRINITY_DN4268_c0_g3_i1:96-3383(+)
MRGSRGQRGKRGGQPAYSPSKVRRSSYGQAAGGASEPLQDLPADLSRAMLPLPAELRRHFPRGAAAGGATERYGWAAARHTESLVIWEMAREQQAAPGPVVRLVLPLDRLAPGAADRRSSPELLAVIFPWEQSQQTRPACVAVLRSPPRAMVIPLDAEQECDTALVHCGTWAPGGEATAACSLPGIGCAVGTASGEVYWLECRGGHVTGGADFAWAHPTKLDHRGGRLSFDMLCESGAQMGRVLTRALRGQPVRQGSEACAALCYAPQLRTDMDGALYAVTRGGVVSMWAVTGDAPPLRRIPTASMPRSTVESLNGEVVGAALCYTSADTHPGLYCLIRHPGQGDGAPAHPLLSCVDVSGSTVADVGAHEGSAVLFVCSPGGAAPPGALRIVVACSAHPAGADAAAGAAGSGRSAAVLWLQPGDGSPAEERGCSAIVACTTSAAPMPGSITVYTAEGWVSLAVLPSQANEQLRAALRSVAARSDRSGPAASVDPVDRSLQCACEPALQAGSVLGSGAEILQNLKDRVRAHAALVDDCARRTLIPMQWQQIGADAEVLAALLAVRELEEAHTPHRALVTQLLCRFAETYPVAESYRHLRLTPLQRFYTDGPSVRTHLLNFLAEVLQTDKSRTTAEAVAALLRSVLDAVCQSRHEWQRKAEQHVATVPSAWTAAPRAVASLQSIGQAFSAQLAGAMQGADPIDTLLQGLQAACILEVGDCPSRNIPYERWLRGLFLFNPVDTDDKVPSAGKTICFRALQSVAENVQKVPLLVDLAFCLPQAERNAALIALRDQHGDAFYTALVRHLQPDRLFPVLLKMPVQLRLEGQERQRFNAAARRVLGNHPLLWGVVGPCELDTTERAASEALAAAGAELHRSALQWTTAPAASEVALRAKLGLFTLNGARPSGEGGQTAALRQSPMMELHDQLAIAQMQIDILGKGEQALMNTGEIFNEIMMRPWKHTDRLDDGSHPLAWAFLASWFDGRRQAFHYEERVADIWLQAFNQPPDWAAQARWLPDAAFRERAEAVSQSVFFQVYRSVAEAEPLAEVALLKETGGADRVEATFARIGEVHADRLGELRPVFCALCRTARELVDAAR